MQTLKVLRTADFAPLVVFIAPTNTAPQVLYLYLSTLKFSETLNSLSCQLLTLCLSSQTENLQMIQKESDAIQTTYGHFFDVVLINNDVDESVKGVEEAMERAISTPQWVPVSWVYWQQSGTSIIPCVCWKAVQYHSLHKTSQLLMSQMVYWYIWFMLIVTDIFCTNTSKNKQYVERLY